MGKWAMSGDDLVPYAHWELFANGSARETTLRDVEVTWFPWRSEGETLVIGSGPAGLNFISLRNVFDSVERLIGWYPFVPRQEWEILSVSGDEFVIKPSGVTKPIHFRRIPE
ncbi:hypothetical protein AYO47_07640 [Planctomyces sp. SCGC AG-212-M04]|nr:hypothetical protein AYO47_07640 [Planctomyces sp. SCGC AG-212-M04]